jgi:site-specific recombinase XerD
MDSHPRENKRAPAARRDDLGDLVARWLDRRPDSEWLLPTRHATQVNTRYLREMTKRKVVAAGIPEADRVTPHVLRHTFATDLLRETKNIRLTQKALGHASLATTMIYTHVADEELETAVRRWRSPQKMARREFVEGLPERQ